MKILYYGGLWPTNMGNSFIDLGALHILKSANPEIEIFHTSRFSRFYAQHRGDHPNLIIKKMFGNQWEALDITQYADVDFVVASGNITNTEFIRIEGPIIHALVNNGAKFIILGGGCSTYDLDEYKAFQDFMRSVSTYAFISRDRLSFEAFNDAAELSFPGIDCGFFISDAFSPMPLRLKDYIVCSFNDQSFENGLGLKKDEVVLRTRHISFGIRERFVKKLNKTLVSDLPYDYLSLYAGAKAVFSDRVHACVAALSYGRQARLFSKTPRAHLFEEVSAGEISRKLVTLDYDLLNLRKIEEITWLSSLFNK